MNRAFSTIACTALICVSMPVFAQSSRDETQIREIATSFEQAWNRHDMTGLAALMAKDADFINVAGHHWKGRAEIQARHEERLGQFKDSVWRTKAVTIQFLKRDIALVHVEWGIKGDTDPDGTARKPREGVFTWVVTKQRRGWEIRSAQNTNLNNPSIVSR